MTRARAVRTVEVLNADYQSLGKVSFQKAMRLLAKAKAVVEECVEEKGIISGFLYPKVIRLVKYVKLNYQRLYGEPLLSKHGVLKRDNWKCAYCGKAAKTIDHVRPRSRGGANSWENLVASCFADNNKKDNKTPEEAGMKLLWQPYVPTKQQLWSK